jgi:hypothetical protein
MPRKETDLIAQAMRIIDAWKRSFPTKSFSALTLAQFEEVIRPARAVRVELADLGKRTKIGRTRRLVLDRSLRPVIQRIVHAVRGDPDVGENSAMYSSMGYVMKRRRRKPGRKKKRSATP